MDDGSQTISLETDEVRILEHREAVDLGIPQFRPHFSLFVPAISVSVMYLAFWAFLFFTGKSSGWVAQLFIASLAIVLPLLFAAAFLRYQTVRVQLIDDALLYHPGWPKDAAKELPISKIASIGVHQGFIDRFFDSGDLLIVTDGNETIELEGLESPDVLLSLINEKIGKRTS